MRFALLTICLLAPLAQAQIYKTVDKDGNVIFSDQPVDKDKSEVIEPDTSTNTIESEHSKEVSKSGWLQKLDARREAEKQAYDEWYKEYAAARKELRKAEKALRNGKDPKEGDYVGFKTGRGTGVRPSDDYLKRVKRLEADVRVARRELKTVLKRKP
jgi:hypothetical protein